MGRLMIWGDEVVSLGGADVPRDGCVNEWSCADMIADMDRNLRYNIWCAAPGICE